MRVHQHIELGEDDDFVGGVLLEQGFDGADLGFGVQGKHARLALGGAGPGGRRIEAAAAQERLEDGWPVAAAEFGAVGGEIPAVLGHQGVVAGLLLRRTG